MIEQCDRPIVVALALAALGATTASATPDMGTTVLVSRMEQVEPSLLIVDRPDTRPAGPWDDSALARLLGAGGGCDHHACDEREPEHGARRG